MSNPWGFPLDIQGKRTRSKLDPIETPSTSIDSSDENVDFDSEVRCKPTEAMRKRSCKLRENKKSTCAECDEAGCVQSEQQSAVSASSSKNSEDLERSESSEQSTNEVEGEFEGEEIGSENCSNSTENEEKPEENDNKENLQNENFSESFEDKKKVIENDNKNEKDKREEDQQPANEENKPQKDDELINKKVAAINTELSKARELLVRVNNFNGSKDDKEFLCLQELLLRCILSLDLIESEGHDKVKTVRRAAVREIQQIISDLEGKVEKL